MSFLRSLAKLFGSKKKHRSPQSEARHECDVNAVHELIATEEMLIEEQELLVKKIEQERAIAKKNSTTNKRAAMQALERKKRYEKQLVQLNSTIDTVKQQRGVLEGTNLNADLLTSMIAATEALKLANQFMTVDNVHDLINDVADSQDLTQELAEAVSNPVLFGTDDELLKELEELEQDELNKQLLNTGTIPVTNSSTPVVPLFKTIALAKTKVQGLAD